MRDGAPAAGSKREIIKRLWKSYFADPSQWWDYRDFKTKPKAPDFQHKTTKEKLFLDANRNPSWVLRLLEKKDQERPSLAFPTQVLEKEKKEKVAVVQRVARVFPLIAMEEPKLKQEKKLPATVMEEPNVQQWQKKQKKQVLNAGAPPCHGKASTGQSRKMKKNYIIGEVCDWHTLSVEESITSLEKGSFAEPSIETLAHIVRKCAIKKNKYLALRLLSYLQRNGLDSDEMLGDDVVSMLVEGESMPQAQVVFDKLVSRSECTWNDLILGYAKNGESQQAIHLYKLMRRDHTLCLSGYTFVALLKACTALKDVKVGHLVHADAAEEGLLKANPFVGNALLDMYAKCGFLVEAQDVFDMLPVRNVITWSSLISGYAQHEHGVIALKCFFLMQGSGVSPNAFTFSSVLKACGSLKNSAVGIEVHAKVEQEGLLATSQIVGNALVDMYAKCGLLKKAQEVFDLLPKHDVISWNVLITGYTEHAYFQEAIMCFERMKAAGISPNGITFACCLKACGNTRAVEKGREIHLEIEGRGLLKKDHILGSSLVDMYSKCGLLDKAKTVFSKLPIQDAFSWTSLIAGYAQLDACEKAIVLFKQMQEKGVSPDAVAYACVLKVCGSIGATSVGIELHNEIVGRGLLRKELLLDNAVVDMYTKFGMLAKAHEVFVAIPAHDVVSWTALLTGYAQLGDFEKVSYIFDRMREEGINPTSVTIVSILHACGNAGLLDTAVGRLQVMSEDYGILPTLEHYTCVIDLLGHAGQINRAAALVFESPFHPNVVMWLTLLGACQKWGLVKLAINAFEQIMLLDNSEASAYVWMSNIYAHAGMHEEAATVEALSVEESVEETRMSHCRRAR